MNGRWHDYKKGPRDLTENYRPISILTATSKIMERILHHQIYQYLRDNYLLSEDQFGFRKLYSTAFAGEVLCLWYVHIYMYLIVIKHANWVI